MKLKHFKSLARVLSTYRADIPPKTFISMVALLCKVLVTFNHNFKADLFTEDCNA